MRTTPFVSIVDYTVPAPELQMEIADAFRAIQEEWVAPYAGFRSARFLASTDGLLIRAIVEWDSEEALHAFERVSDTQGRLAALEAAFRKHSTKCSRQTLYDVGTVQPKVGRT